MLIAAVTTRALQLLASLMEGWRAIDLRRPTVDRYTRRPADRFATEASSLLIADVVAMPTRGLAVGSSGATFRTRMDAFAMENYDILMLVILIAAVIFGAVKGFAWQLASIASIVVSYVVAYRFREPFSQSIQADPPWNRFLAMLILYVGTSLVIWVTFRMVHGTIDRLRLREFDRQVGAMFGLAKGLLYCVLITLFSVTLLGDRTREAVVGSHSGRYIAHTLDRSGAVIPPEIHEVIGPYLDRFQRQWESPEGMLESSVAGGWLDQPAGDRSGWESGILNPPPLPVEPNVSPPQQARQPRWDGLQR